MPPMSLTALIKQADWLLALQERENYGDTGD